MLGWGHYLRDLSATGNIVRRADIGIAVSVEPGGAGTALIANNVIAETRRGAVVGMARAKATPGVSPSSARSPMPTPPSAATGFVKYCTLLMCRCDASPLFAAVVRRI
jgi:hypothetical protein